MTDTFFLHPQRQLLNNEAHARTSASVPSPAQVTSLAFFFDGDGSSQRASLARLAERAKAPAIPATAWWLLLANVFWAIAYDTEYAMVDREDDLKIGIKTSAMLTDSRATSERVIALSQNARAANTALAH